MRTINAPRTEEDWYRLASGLIRAHLGLSNMSLLDLERELAAFGIKEKNQNLSLKISRGRFSAAFFLQVLACVKAKDLQLPTFD